MMLVMFLSVSWVSDNIMTRNVVNDAKDKEGWDELRGRNEMM